MSISIVETRSLTKTFRTYYEKCDSIKRKVFSFGKLKSSYHEVHALKDISVCVHDGETLGVIGPNGSGKTTFLKLLAKIYPPTSGEMIIRGRVTSLLDLGIGFQSELTGRENLLLYGAIHGISERKMRDIIDEIIDFSELEEFIDSPVKHYSAGMYTRLGFSAATAMKPDVFLIDEVFAAGDAQFQKKSFKKIVSMVNQSKALIIVSHNMHIIKQLCDNALLIDNGSMIKYGPAVDTVNHYLQMQGEKI